MDIGTAYGLDSENKVNNPYRRDKEMCVFLSIYSKEVD